MKKDNILWGILFLLGAVFLIISHLGFVEGVSILTVFLTVLFIGILINSIFHLNFAGILFPIAFLCILYDDVLGLEAITPWPVLGAALLGTIGLSMIFHKKKTTFNGYHGGVNSNQGFEKYDKVVNEQDEEMVRCEANFSSVVKYVNSNHFTFADVDCSFGAVKMYFDNAILKGNTATIHVDCSFGGVELFIPHTWRVDIRAKNAFGGVEEKNKAMVFPEGAPTVVIEGDVSFAGLTIIYI